MKMMMLSAFVRGTLEMILLAKYEIVHCIVVEQSEVRISICTVSIPFHFIGPLYFLQLSRPGQFTTDLQQKKFSDNVVS